LGDVAVSADGRSAASVLRGRLHVWDMATGDERWSSKATEFSWALAFAPDNRLLATGERDGIVRLWDPVTGNQLQELVGHDSDVTSLAWSADCRRLVSAAANVAIIWDVASIKK
jgi:WD40 repeat protein